MIFPRIRNIRTFVALALALIFAVSARGFAASNTVPGSAAGDGSATISGYTITDVTYTLNSTNPQNLDNVRFTVTAPAGTSAPSTVRAQLVSGGSWSTCGNGGSGTTWTCTLTNVSAAAANNLTIVAAQ
jgi:hypothetical protein